MPLTYTLKQWFCGVRNYCRIASKRSCPAIDNLFAVHQLSRNQSCNSGRVCSFWLSLFALRAFPKSCGKYFLADPILQNNCGKIFPRNASGTAPHRVSWARRAREPWKSPKRVRDSFRTLLRFRGALFRDFRASFRGALSGLFLDSSGVLGPKTLCGAEPIAILGK